MITKIDTNQIILTQRRNCLQFLIWLFLLSFFSVFLFSSPAFGALTDNAINWSLFTSGSGYTYPYTYLGQPIADHETSSDPSHGSAAIPPSWTDLSSASPSSPPGPEATPSYGYYPGTTPYDPSDPTSIDDDYVFFRMRIGGDPTQSKCI